MELYTIISIVELYTIVSIVELYTIISIVELYTIISIVELCTIISIVELYTIISVVELYTMISIYLYSITTERATRCFSLLEQPRHCNYIWWPESTADCAPRIAAGTRHVP